MSNNTENIEQLKAKHGDVYTLTVKNKQGEEITVYLRELDRILYKSVSAMMEKDTLSGVEVLLKGLWIGGQDVKKITEDFTALRSAANSIAPMLSVEEGVLKKN